ncbi:iron ABC transporter permease [Desulfatiferula olefinivorans]
MKLSVNQTLMFVIPTLCVMLVLAVILGLSTGSSAIHLGDLIQVLRGEGSAMMESILWRIRLPRVLMAALSGAVLSLGGLVFQALLRNPLAEPYILGVSGGSAIGAIIGIMIGLSRFPGVGLTAFFGSMITLTLVVLMASRKNALKKESVILSGVMVNAFCSALIMFLISLTQDSKIHTIMFWLMGDLSSADMTQTGILAVSVLPCFVLIFLFAHTLNLLLLGDETAMSLGVNVQLVGLVLLVTTSFMVSATVCQGGLLGFVGLVIPHIFRMMLGPDHRILVPSCLLGGAAYLVVCDLLARVLPDQGEMPVGVITAMIGAPVFIVLLKKQKGNGLS